MAIDRLSKRQEEEKKLTELIEKRPIGDELSKIAENVATTRYGLTQELQSKVPGIDVSRAVRERTPFLTDKAEAQISQLKLKRETEKYNLIFNNVYQMAIDAGYDQDQAENYASRIAEQNREFEFKGGEAEEERVSARRMNELANVYSQRGIALEKEFEPQFDYENALLRGLIGTGTALGTGAILRRGRTPKSVPPIPGLTSNYKESESLRSGTKFALPLSRKPQSFEPPDNYLETSFFRR